MKRFLIKIIVFLLPIIFVAVCLEFGLRCIPNDYSYKNSWMDENISQVKTLIMGSSHGLDGINPNLLDGIAFNAAYVSQNLNYDDFIFSKFADKADSLKYLVLPVSYFSLCGSDYIGGMESWRNKKYVLYYNYPYDYLKPMYYLEIWDGKLFKMCKNIGGHVLLNHNRIVCDSLGWNRHEDIDWEDDSYIAVKRHTGKINLENVAHIQHMIELCKKKKACVILITTPTYKTYYEKLDKNQLSIVTNCCDSIARTNNNVIYLNFLVDNRFDKGDFHNSDHLSESGATKLTLILQQTIDSLELCDQ